MSIETDAVLAPYLAPAARRVRGEVFKPSGKWGYTVSLDYSQTATIQHQPSGYIEPSEAAALALATATRAGTSEVTFERLPEGWRLVTFEPPNGWPVMATGGRPE